MKYFALALVAVLAMATVTMAAPTVSVDQGTDIGYGLTKYIVSGGGSNAFSDAYFEAIAGCDPAGPVYQMCYAGNPVAAGLDSKYNEEVTACNATDLAFDTHWMFKTTDPGFLALNVTTESNAGGNPQSVPVTPGLTNPGWGNLGGPVGAGFSVSPGVLLPEGTELMQVVIKTGSTVKLHYMTNFGTDSVPMEQIIGVPEPGTIIMLVAGALCLLGIRRK